MWKKQKESIIYLSILTSNYKYNRRLRNKLVFT